MSAGVSAKTYSVEEHTPWSIEVLSVKTRVEELCKIKGLGDHKFDYALISMYKSGDDYISYHSDSEVVSGKEVIASLSLGGTRRFCLKKNTGDVTLNMSLEGGDLLLMSGSTQDNWKHSVPKTQVEPRINITFCISK